MYNMEDKSHGKGKNEIVRTKLHDKNYIRRRPKNFSFERRSDVYYFSDNSARGILKRVPVKNGSYNLNELETVLEKSVSGKIQNEIWSDVPINDTGSSKVDKNNTVDKNDYLYQSVHHDQKDETVLKSLDETARIKLQSLDLKSLSTLKDYKDYSKSKNDNEEPLKFSNQDQNEDSFYKRFIGRKQKTLHQNTSISTDSKNLKESDSDEGCEKLFASNMGSISSKKTEEYNNESLSETLTERSLTGTLKMSRKTLYTEL